MLEVEHKSIELENQNCDPSNDYATKLHLAVKDNNLKHIQRLIGDGFHVQSVDNFGRTPLHWALVFGYQKVAYALIINTPKTGLDYKDDYGCTPLHYAALGGRTDVGRILLERGAFINSIDSKERTPLHYAAQNARPDMVEMLVSRGANKTCLDSKGFLPSDLALEWGSFPSLVCLRQNGFLKSEEPSNLKDLKYVECSKVEMQAQQTESIGEDINIAKDHSSTVKKGSPSLDKLMLAWKNIQNNAKKKRDLEAKWIAQAYIALEDNLEQWREAEKEAKQRKQEGWSLTHNTSSTLSPWRTESLKEAELFQHTHKTRLSQMNCGENISTFEASTSTQEPINPFFFSTSQSSYSLPSTPFSNLSTTHTQTLKPDIISPKVDDPRSVTIETLGSSTPISEVGPETSYQNQNIAQSPQTVFCITIPYSSCVIPESSSTSITTSGSSNPSISFSEDISKHNRFLWCLDSNPSLENSSSPQQLGEVESKYDPEETDDLRWCTEWEFESPEISQTRTEYSHKSTEMQGSPAINACDKISSVAKGKEKAFFEEEPMWVQVWPKPAPSSSSFPFSSKSRTMTSM